MELPSQVKPNIGFKIKRFGANVLKANFFALGIARAILSPRPPIRILFSANQYSEKNIRRGFRFLRHKINFNAFTQENIRKSDLVVPLNIDDVRILQKSRHWVENNPIPIPSLSALNICDDKYLFSKTLTEKGFKDTIPKTGNDLPLPFMLKKRVTMGGISCHFISSPDQKDEFRELISSPDYFCQEIIEGTNEYATHILFKDQKIVTSLTIRYEFYDRIFINGKAGFVCTKIRECDHLDTFAAILEAIGFEGLCCFDYKIVNGKPKIFEINPRFGGSLSSYFFTFLHQLNLNAA
jgi:predicted ATP-grasp superfamily ATP-dependent carboligase